MPHCFEVELAERYGLLEAILLNYFRFWIKKNEANEVHFHDGMYWTYNSVRAFCELFPYASKKMIEKALNHLEEEGLIITGNFNKSPYDRTKWYTVTEKGMCDCHCGDTDFPHRGNGNPPQGKPIPVNNTVNNTFNRNVEIEEIVSYLNEKVGSKYRPSTEATQKHINARLEEKFTIDDFKAVIDKKADEWLGTDMQKFLRPQTLFGTKFESYLNQPTSSKRYTVPVIDSEEAKERSEAFDEIQRREREEWERQHR